jgi:hypothetical protein
MESKVIKRFKNGNALVEITRTVKTVVHVFYNDVTMTQDEIDAGEWCFGTDTKVFDELTNENMGAVIESALVA